MAKFCPQCGKPVNPGDKFCSNCAAKLDRNAETSSPGSGTVGGQAGREGITINFPESVKIPALPSMSDNLPLVIADGALLVILLLMPWITTYFTADMSLPSLVKYSMKAMSTAQQYSDYAYQYGGGSLYEDAMGLLVGIALIAGVGGACAAYGLVKDAMNDYKGQRANGMGALLCGLLGIVVIVIVLGAKAWLTSELKNDYLDLSYVSQNIFGVTVWVWVAAVGGLGLSFYRKKLYGEI